MLRSLTICCFWNLLANCIAITVSWLFRQIRVNRPPLQHTFSLHSNFLHHSCRCSVFNITNSPEDNRLVSRVCGGFMSRPQFPDSTHSLPIYLWGLKPRLSRTALISIFPPEIEGESLKELVFSKKSHLPARNCSNSRNVRLEPATQACSTY